MSGGFIVRGRKTGRQIGDAYPDILTALQASRSAGETNEVVRLSDGIVMARSGAAETTYAERRAAHERGIRAGTLHTKPYEIVTPEHDHEHEHGGN